MDDLRRLFQTLDIVFHLIPNTLVLENSAATPLFLNPPLGVWISDENTASCV